MSCLHILQHVPFEGPAAIADWAAARGHEVAICHLYAGDPLPTMASGDWLVVMGGPMSVHDEADYPWLVAEKQAIAAAIAAGERVIGICLGAQLIAEVLGGVVSRNPEREIGWYAIDLDLALATTWLGELLATPLLALHWHGETFSLPQKAAPLGSTAACALQGFLWQERVVALQFHLEMSAASAAAIIDGCQDELAAGGGYVQPALELLADPRRFEESQQQLFALLDGLAAQ
jgi:GMP synthase-like glutamine amidotransferase